jgi:hypothetical protein
MMVSIPAVSMAVRKQRDEIEELGSINMDERISALQHHDRVADILEGGCAILNSMKVCPLSC